jgi:hypothetical protein
MRDKLTLSEVVERYLSCIAQATPAQADEDPIVTEHQTPSPKLRKIPKTLRT